MWFAARRLALGTLLIVLACATLLLSDLDRRVSTREVARVGLLRFSSALLYDESVQGVIDGLAAAGFRDGDRMELTQYNAESDIGTANAIASEMTSGRFDLVITLGTPALQAVANANRSGRVLHVFGTVANPRRAGVGVGEDPLDHPSHLVGIGSFIKVDGAFRLARRMFPGLQRVGMPWNAAESNSVVFTGAVREICKELGIELLEANVDNTAAVGEAVASLIARGAEALWVSGDNTVVSAAGTVIAAAQRARIPVLTMTPGNAERGALFDYGPDFHEIGYATGTMAGRILSGTDPKTIPVDEMSASGVKLNTTVVTSFRDTWTIPEDVVRDALVVIDEKGRHERPRNGSGAARPSPEAPGEPWQIDVIEYNNVADVEEAEQGVLDGLKEAGLVEGRDYRVRIRNAQGDMATVSGLVDAALIEGARMLITLSTPTLQAALQRSRDVPIVFTYVADAVAAGAGRSDTDHLPNVTGIYMAAAYDEMLALVREVLPSAKRLGSLYVPAEVNTVFHRDRLLEAADRTGYEVVVVAANTAAEVPDAALSLVSMKLDAIVQLPGNLTAASFPSIAQAARRARLPTFVFQTSQVKAGAVLAMARDYYDGGRDAAMLAARIIRGESPAAIPFEPLLTTRLIVNLQAAREIALTVPKAVFDRADTRIGN